MNIFIWEIRVYSVSLGERAFGGSLYFIWSIQRSDISLRKKTLKKLYICVMLKLERWREITNKHSRAHNSRVLISGILANNLFTVAVIDFAKQDTGHMTSKIQQTDDILHQDSRLWSACSWNTTSIMHIPLEIMWTQLKFDKYYFHYTRKTKFWLDRYTLSVGLAIPGALIRPSSVCVCQSLRGYIIFNH